MFSEKDLLFLVVDRALSAPVSGAFARRILILGSRGTAEDPTRSFLIKILSAVQINLEKDTLFVEYPDQSYIPLAPLLKEKQPETVLVFGIPPKLLCLALHPPLYQPLDFYGATWLWSDALPQIENNKDKKMQLWRAMQVMFL
jgi:hypothetical protein